MARWLVLVAVIVAPAGCYSEPRPACGFVCGEGASCPGGYTCNAADNRCHLDGTSVQCDSGIDAAPPDTTPPIVKMLSPADGDTDVPLGASIIVLFSEPVLHYDSQDGFNLQDASGLIVCSPTATSEGPDFRVEYKPLSTFTGRAVLTASLNSAIIDDAGNALAPTSWTFTLARDDIPPVITQTFPSDGSFGIDPAGPIVVSFNEPIKFMPDSVTLDQGATGMLAASAPYELTFTPNPVLAAATTYTVTVATSVTDLSDNPIPAPFVFSFTTM